MSLVEHARRELMSSDRGATYRYIDDREDTGRHMTDDVTSAHAKAARAPAQDLAATPVDQCAPPPLAPVGLDVPYVACDACEGDGKNCRQHPYGPVKWGPTITLTSEQARELGITGI